MIGVLHNLLLYIIEIFGKNGWLVQCKPKY
jgi:hypothetical protein